MATWFEIMHAYSWSEVERRNARIMAEVPASLWMKLLVRPAADPRQHHSALTSQLAQSRTADTEASLQQAHAHKQAAANGASVEPDTAGTSELRSPGFPPRPVMAAWTIAQAPTHPAAPAFAFTGQQQTAAPVAAAPHSHARSNAAADTTVTVSESTPSGSSASASDAELTAFQQTAVFGYNPGPHDVRWCRKCEAVKPPRAHHCSLCGTCVLKMDHHCPWVRAQMLSTETSCCAVSARSHFSSHSYAYSPIAYTIRSLRLLAFEQVGNCVGFYNYKPFYLLLVHGLLACTLVAAVWSPIVWRAWFPLVQVGHLDAAASRLLSGSSQSMGVWSPPELAPAVAALARAVSAVGLDAPAWASSRLPDRSEVGGGGGQPLGLLPQSLDWQYRLSQEEADFHVNSRFAFAYGGNGYLFSYVLVLSLSISLFAFTFMHTVLILRGTTTLETNFSGCVVVFAQSLLHCVLHALFFRFCHCFTLPGRRHDGTPVT